MKTFLKNKKWIAGLSGVVAMMIFMVAFLQWPANQFTLDVNPSIEITTNRLDKVTKIKALNEDAEDFLAGYEMKERGLEAVLNNLVDRMILTGHISGGQDNVVMITVKNEELNGAYVNKVNEAVAAFLENKQLEYMILSQGWNENTSSAEDIDISRGKMALIQNILEHNKALSAAELAEISLLDLIDTAEQMSISPQELFVHITRSHVKNISNGEVIGREKAIEIALAKVGGGTVVEFEYDREDGEYEVEIYHDRYEYKVEIDAFTGDVNKFEKELDDDAQAHTGTSEVIGREKAIEIALAKVGGGTVVEFEYDREDGKYEVEIKFDGKEYELEIDAYSGQILEIEIDD